MTKIKICGLKRPEDIEMINRLRPDYCGFIINFPRSHRSVTPDGLRKLAAAVDRNAVQTVGVFVDRCAEEVAGLLNEGVIDIAQLHGNEDEQYIRKLRSLTGKTVIKAFKITDKNSVAEAAKSSADYILLDRGQGSGEVFDWSVLEGNESLKGCRWFLAGGLNDGNIKTAIEHYHPYAVDLSSSVETDGIKDEAKIEKIMKLIREDNI